MVAVKEAGCEEEKKVEVMKFIAKRILGVSDLFYAV